MVCACTYRRISDLRKPKHRLINGDRRRAHLIRLAKPPSKGRRITFARNDCDGGVEDFIPRLGSPPAFSDGTAI
jgi:hypothetical protein